MPATAPQRATLVTSRRLAIARRPTRRGERPVALVRLSGVSVGFGAAPLLDGVEVQIERGERVCLVGRNGSGKSTLLRVIAGELEVDDGVVQRMPELRVGTLPQEVPAGMGGKVFAVAASGLGELGELLARHQTLSQRLASGDQ